MASFKGRQDAVQEALVTLGWTAVTQNCQWTDEALSAIAIEAGIWLKIHSKNSDTISSFGP